MDGKIRLVEREIHTGQTETDRVRLLGDLILQTFTFRTHHGGRSDHRHRV
jgi:hypothetical protein